MDYKAFLFDLNGTMIDDMQYHVKAWHRIFNELGANISMERMKQESYGKNHEVIERVMPGRFSEEEKTEMSFAKERQYQKEYKPHLRLIAGLDIFLEKAYQQDIKMAIGSAAIMFNIDFVLDGLDLRKYFSAIVSADDVSHSKPDPETFLRCAEVLNVDPKDCIVFEDAPKGVESAQNAGMRSVVLTILHEQHEFDQYKNIVVFAKDYKDKNFLDFFGDSFSK
jgi:beta-phosphoglucomutase family hydrolase